MLKAFIDLKALLSNIKVIKSKTESKLYAVVKANAYGHGLAVATFMQPYVDGFCVATFEEAKKLVELAIYKPVIIMGAVDFSQPVLEKNNIIYTVTSGDDLKRFEDLRRRPNYYIKVNSGMNRLGCDQKSFKDLIEYADEKKYFPIGAFTHFRNADGDKKSVEEQFEVFENITKSGSIALSSRHCCASSCLFLDKKYHLDLVRCGIALYGYSPFCSGLKPVMKVAAPIIQVFDVKKGECVGYGNYTMEKDCRIAVARIGYGDGYRRISAPERKVSVNGVICPVIGQVCMDMCMIDVSRSAVQKDDYAFILGNGIDGQTLASNCGTIVYEILTSFHDRIERIYINE